MDPRANQIEQEQVSLAIESSQSKIDKMIADMGGKVALNGHHMIIVDKVTPDDALKILFRLRSEESAAGASLKHIRLWQGDFASEYATLMGIPMSKAANELAEVWGEKPKRIIRLVNTSERSPDEFRKADVDYTLLQDLADMPEDKDEEVRQKVFEAKVEIVRGVAEEGKDSAWAKERIRTIRRVAEPKNPEVKPTLEGYLIHFYNLQKYYMNEGCDPEKAEASLASLSVHIENLANSRGYKLWYEMDECPLCEQDEELTQEQLDELTS